MTELMNFAQSVAREAGELILCEREQAALYVIIREETSW